jgi:hypothetical protein
VQVFVRVKVLFVGGVFGGLGGGLGEFVDVSLDGGFLGGG